MRQLINSVPVHCRRIRALTRDSIGQVFGVAICSPSMRGGMKLLARRFLGSLWFGLLLAILTSSLLLPSTVRAGCAGHYGNSPSPGNSGVAHLELLSLTGAIPAPAEGMPGDRPKPCSGALCSGNPAPPLSTIPSVPPSSGDQWALPAFLGTLVDSGVFQRLPAGTDVRPVDHPCSIFHPPRFQVL